MSTRALFMMAAPLLLAALPSRSSEALDSKKKAEHPQQWEYLDNGIVRIGIDKSRGACIGYFAESKTRRNLLNNYDEGRFIQQSYYGRPDGSKWNGKPWVYNPVQGGHSKGKRSRLLKFTRDQDKKTISARVEPLSWASGVTCPEALMGVTISLEGPSPTTSRGCDARLGIISATHSLQLKLQTPNARIQVLGRRRWLRWRLMWVGHGTRSGGRPVLFDSFVLEQ